MIEFHQLALAELRDAQRWYRTKSRETAERFLTRVDQAIERLVADPESLPLIGRDNRSIRVPRFPYLLVYRIQPNGPFVVAVAHTSRRRGYWSRRK
ncbi:MAG TPA: type II toxin-antitoxin system RelE/ParE family toxin [Planctomycetaceae bacterium]|nr:type II toxin-antitoxin system RelE/ParE family toxin [Planctomycetaceae bacterium]